ncbi:MAG: major facilitator transporter [Clostridiales bacterium]|jgi:FSR family fosmidomycin resistance protein-like MFS transporter|nr:major facilitator transporter [Clostridiales bacterium]
MPWLQLLILSAAHMVTDFAQGAIPILITNLKESLSLNYTQATAIFLASNIASSFVQPVFGVISDRHKLFWLMPAGVALAMLGIALAGIIPNYYLVLTIIFITGLGIAGFHPEASKATHFLSYGPKKATAMSIFSVGGNVGIGLGPLLAAGFIAVAGLKGTLFFLVPGIMMILILKKILPQVEKAMEAHQKSILEENKKNSSPKETIQVGALVLLIIVVVVRSWIHAGLLNFIPLYFIDFLGESDFYGSLLLTVFLIAGAVGTLIGGPLADYFGPKTMVCWSMILSLPLTYLIYNSEGIWTVIFTALDGAVLICTFGITVVFGQKLLPNKIGLASGLMLGFAIGTGGFGATLLGYIADTWNIFYALKFMFALPLLGSILALFLPKVSGQRKTKMAVSKSSLS